MTVVSASKLENPVCGDPDDDNILAAAISSNCDCIITGDKDLLVLKQHEGINIFSARDFLMNEKVD
jgi:predicted nucleic acid-binding protein